MALEAAFRDLVAQLQTLRADMIDLRTTVREDTPAPNDVALVDMLGDTIDDVLGWIEEALTDAVAGRQALEQRIDLQAVLRALASCQERIDRIEMRFATGLIHYEPIAELARLGRKRGGEWRAWSSSVKQALEACRAPLWDVRHRLSACWQEVGEQVGMLSFFLRLAHPVQPGPPPERVDVIGSQVAYR